MATNSSYLDNLRAFAHQEELKKLRTLALEFAPVLDSFPQARKQIDSLLKVEKPFDGDALVASLRPQLLALTQLRDGMESQQKPLRARLSNSRELDALLTQTLQSAAPHNVSRVTSEFNAEVFRLSQQAQQEENQRRLETEQRQRKAAEEAANRKAAEESEKERKRLVEEQVRQRKAAEDERRREEQRKADQERHRVAAEERRCSGELRALAERKRLATEAAQKRQREAEIEAEQWKMLSENSRKSIAWDAAS